MASTETRRRSTAYHKRKREAGDEQWLARKREVARRYAAKPENRLKIQARNKIKHLCRVGKVTRGPCEVCGGSPTHAHHDDYTKPLDVRWLCRQCHDAVHRPALPARPLRASAAR